MTTSKSDNFSKINLSKNINNKDSEKSDSSKFKSLLIWWITGALIMYDRDNTRFLNFVACFSDEKYSDHYQ